MEGVMSTEQDMLNHYMKNNLDKLKEIAKPRSKEAITKAAERRIKRLKGKIWHNSNEEQPDGNRVIVCYHTPTNMFGDVGKYSLLKPNYRWAYLEDLDSEYVECGNCVNDKGCIVCEHEEQKQILA